MKFDIDGLEEFAKALDDAANGSLKDKMVLWLEAMGFEFLDIVQDEIIETGTVDTGRLLSSFNQGDRENIWSLSEGNLTIDLGTNLNYASYVNDGHWTNKQGVSVRWVPGYWNGDRFVYDPGADTGMALKQQWVPGTHYWDFAFAIFEKTFSRNLKKKLQQWLDETF